MALTAADLLGLAHVRELRLRGCSFVTDAGAKACTPWCAPLSRMQTIACVPSLETIDIAGTELPACHAPQRAHARQDHA